MAAAPARGRTPRWLLSFFCATALLAAVSALEFRVGGERGWHLPTADETTYDQWAGRNRFHVGDSVYFKYGNDSVLVVDADDYRRCNTASPLRRFQGHDAATFTFDRSGFFYFISGQQGHCEAGQRLVVRVMVHPRYSSPAPAPVPDEGSGGLSWSPGPSGFPTASSSSKLWMDLCAGMAAFLVALLGAGLLV